jgi:hypothetical protein
MNKKNNIFSIIIWIIFYFAVFFFFLYNSFNYLDPDLGWHLKIGQEIWQNKAVPSAETHYYTLVGQSWVDHEWLSNVFLYLIYNHFGYIWLSIFYALLPTVVFFTLNFFIINYLLTGANSAAVFTFLLPLEVLGAPAIASHSGVRIQEVGVLFLLFLFIIIYKFTQSEDWRYLLLLIPLLFLWSCLHGSFLIAIFLLFFWLGIQLTTKFLKQHHFLPTFAAQRECSTKSLIIFTALSLLAISLTLLNPYGIKLYAFLADWANSFYMSHISEWLPVYTYPIQYFQMFYLAGIAGWLLIYFLSYFLSKKTNQADSPAIDYWELAILLLFFCLAFKSRRHFPLFFVTSLLVVPKIIASELRAINFYNFFSSWLVKSYLLTVLLLTITMLIVKTNFANDPFTNPRFCRDYPCQAINFLKSSTQNNNLRLFSNYDWGGFLTWVYPEKKLFVDGRMPQYPFRQRSLMEEYYNFFDKEKTISKLQEYNIQLILLKPNQLVKVRWWEKFLFGIDENKYNDSHNYQQEYLDASPYWRLAYADKISRIYVRK